MERRCKVCGKVLRITQGDVGPVCGGIRRHKIDKKKYRKIHQIMAKKLFGGIDEQGNN